MSKEHLKAILGRIATWPEERQQQLAELAVEIEAEMSDRPYEATLDELESIDEGIEGEAAGEDEIDAAFAALRQDAG
jgi:hypothetical protein